jgi:hypothetical protein
MTTYNGWTNYATWRINLEIFDGMELGDFWGYHDEENADAYELGQQLSEYADEILNEQASGLALDYALAFISDVNWTEIAQSLIDNANEE